MSDKATIASFLELSSHLTGVAVSSFAPINRETQVAGRAAKPADLEARNSPVQLAGEYLQLLEGWNGGRAIARALNEFSAIQVPTTPTDKIREMLKDAELGPLCRSIIKLWYLGVWYAPDRPRIASQVVSSQAYVEGLAWKAMQAHPAGYSMGYFGHWAEVPPPLEDFLTITK